MNGISSASEGIYLAARNHIIHIVVINVNTPDDASPVLMGLFLTIWFDFWKRTISDLISLIIIETELVAY